MAKVIAWLILIFVVLFALRMISMRNARARQRAADPGTKANPANPGAPMVRCVRCGVFLPRAEAVAVNGGHACTDAECAKR